MAGLFGLSIDSQKYQGNFLDDLFWGTFYRQHLGEKYAGLATQQNGELQLRTHRGLFRPTFGQDLNGLVGTEGIGYCGLAREPFLSESKLGKICLCFSGNIVNLAELIDRFKRFGHTFERSDDIEVMAKLLAQGNDMIDGIKQLAAEIKGAYSLLILTQEGIYAVRCPTGQWPLVLGEKEGAVVVASESGGFFNLGFQRVRDLEPGEIVFLKNGSWQKIERIISGKIQICSFLWVYTSFPNAVFEGISASLVRKKLGAYLAQRDIQQGFVPDFVAPVPDSGRFHAIGYHQEFCRQAMTGQIGQIPLYDEILLKYPYAGRSYTPLTQMERNLEAHIKLLISGESYQGKKVVICDDSIVRGTQTKNNLVPKLRALGIKEIHLRISNPELRSYCPWGKTTKKDEVFVLQYPTREKRVKFLGVESLEYCTIDELVQAIGLPCEQLCIDCDLDNE
ncbi:MAG: amidophosphoribosyltransferase [Minisyncoccales bacterium]